METEEINIIIKQLEQIERESFSPQNDELFTDAKNMLMENAASGLKSRLANLSYCYFPNQFWDDTGEPEKNIDHIKKLIQLYKEKLFELSNPTSQTDLYKKSYYKRKIILLIL